jgi:SOS-response transcriptional repressor LexA
MMLRRRHQEDERRRRPLARSRRTRKITPEYHTVEVEHYGSIDCGRVLPFVPASELVTVAIPPEMAASDVFTLKVRGISLTDLGVYDGDLLICRRRFSIHQITERTVCAVYIHSTGELVAKRIIRGANMLTLRASGGNIPDREVAPDDIEIKGIVFAVQRPI